jgi:hypothetical protein
MTIKDNDEMPLSMRWFLREEGIAKRTLYLSKQAKSRHFFS